jgi:lysophospholipase L1-like esterase
MGSLGKGFGRMGAPLGKAGTSGPSANAYEQIVGSNARNAKASFTTGASTTRLETRRLSVLGGQSVTYLKLAYSNYWVDTTGAENTLGNSYTLEAAIEIPTAPTTSCVRVTFSGSNTGTVPDGAAIFISDQIPASAFGYANGVIPAGTQIFIHDSVLVSAGQFIPVPSAYTPSTGEKSVQNNNGASQVMTPGVPTGTEANLQSPLIAVIGKFTAPEVSIAVFGDSIADFGVDTNSSGVNGTSGGIMVRAMWGVNGRNIPWVNLARSSSTAATASAGMSRRLKTMMYATHLVSEAGTNDLAAGTTAAVTQAALQAEWGMASNLGISHVAQMLLVPRTTSTDSWATVVNQTPIAGFTTGAARDTLNAAIIANVGSNGLNEVLDVPSVVADAGTPTAWKAPNYTIDGIHPASTALTAAATYLSGQFAAYVGAPSAIASAVGAEATAVAAAFTTPPTAVRLQAMDFSIKCAKGYGLWTILDGVWFMAAADSQAATINWKSPGTFNLAIVGSPTFVADRGFTGDGSTSKLNTQIVPSAGGLNYTLNSAHTSAWSLSSVAASASSRIIGNLNTTTPRVLLNPLSTANAVNWIINDATFGGTGTGTTTLGLHTIRRTANNARSVLRDTTLIISDAQASTALPTTAITFLGDVATISSGIQLATGSVGALLSSVQIANLRNGVMLPYLQAVGAQ